MSASPFRIRDAEPRDTELFMEVVALADPDDPAPFAAARDVLEMPSPLRGQHTLALTAATRGGAVAGVLLAGVPRWVYEHPWLGAAGLVPSLARRLCMVHAVAVRAEYRGGGIGRALIRRAEDRFRRAGWGVMTLDHQAELDGYYSAFGYVPNDAIIVSAPGKLLMMSVDRTRTSVKPLDPSVRLVDVANLPVPVIAGLLPGTEVADGLRFDGFGLRT